MTEAPETFMPDDYEPMLDLIGQVLATDCEGTFKQKPWLRVSQLLGFKLYGHLRTIELLARPQVWTFGPRRSREFIDVQSMGALVRTALENYTVFYWVFMAKSYDHTQLRMRAWRYASLKKRSNLKLIVTEDNREAQQAKLDQEEADRQQLKKELLESELFDEEYPTDSARNKLLNTGDWKGTKQWPDLAVDAGLHGQFFRNNYNFATDMSHSGFQSMRVQDECLKGSEQQQRKSEGFGHLCTVIMGLFIHTYCELFPEAKVVFNSASAEVKVAVATARATMEDAKTAYGAK